MQIYVDAKYFGNAMRHGRSNAGIKKRDVAKIFGMTAHEYNRIEAGRKIWPGNMMFRLMTLAFLQLRTRRVNGSSGMKPLQNDPDEAIFVDAD